MRGIGGFYTVLGEDGEDHTLRAQGKLRRQRMTPMVGDVVRYTLGRDAENSWLTEILERKTCLIRPPVSNIDKMLLTVSAGFPKADLLMIDRLFLLCAQTGIEPILVINKSDQDEREAAAIEAQYKAAACVYRVCAKTGAGIDALRDALRGTIHALGGQSGVGKSTIINALYGLNLRTGVLSDKIERGKHTTRHCELYPVPGGGMVLDTPGFSLLELDLIEPLRLKTLYPEFAPYEGLCRFTPCAHYREPNCALHDAVGKGLVDENRYGRYQTLFEEMSQRWRERYD